MSSIRIVIYGINYRPEQSGIAPYTAGLAEHLARRGWDVTVVTGFPHYPDWKRTAAPELEISEGVKIVRAGHAVPRKPNVFGRLVLEVSWTVSAWSVSRGVRNADLALGVVPTLGGAVLALLVARRLRVPAVVWFQDLMGPAARQSGVSGGVAIAAPVAMLERALARYADRVIVSSNYFTPYLLRGGVDPEKVKPTLNWSFLGKPLMSRHQARRRFTLPPTPLVLYSGSMGAKQGLELLISAAMNMPDVGFVLQGGGSVRLALMSRAEGLPNVHFMGSLEALLLTELLACVDVLLLIQRESVRDMSIPSKLMNYAQSGTPIVASVHEESAAAHLLADLNLGLVVSPGSPEALEAGIRELLEEARNRSRPPIRRPAEADAVGGPDAVRKILEDVALAAERN